MSLSVSKPDYLEKVVSLNEIAEIANKIRNSGKTIATLNGSFDLMHAGHLYIIHQASLQADYLIIGLNSDSSIKQYKSASRPIIPLEYRAQMMAALGFVDYVTSFDETTPFNFIEAVHPDVHVNGSEYGKDCIEAPLVNQIGAKLHVVDLVPGLSTTEIVKKIKSLCD